MTSTENSSESDPFWTDDRLNAVRAATPGTRSVAHFNNAGAALVSQTVHQAVVDHLELEATIGGYEAAEAAEPKIEQLYCDAADLLGAQPAELAVVESATRAWSSALSGLQFEAGDRIITTASEYVSNALGLLRVRDRYGVEIDLAAADQTGAVDPDAVAALIGPRTRAICLTHVPTQGGLVQPAAAIGQIAREHDVLYMLDACQSVGQLRVDVGEFKADMVSFTGRKFVRGPRGTGMLWIGEHALDQFGSHVGLDGGHVWGSAFETDLPPTTRRFTPFELPIPAEVGLGQALSELLDVGIDNVERRVVALAEHTRERLAEIPGVELHDLGAERCGIVTFTHARATPVEIKQKLRDAAINVSVTDAGSARFDLPERGIDNLVRASVHYYNSHEEIERLLEHVAAV